MSMVEANTYEVVVDGETETRHRVHMSQEYFRELCGGMVTHEWVLVQAFQFLLEHEANTQILSEFDLRDISRYFADFESVVKQRLNR
ncbi:MAG: hypothetical protein O3A63_00825 [Proteobacteria bacterium]|nr:hypothetical protein [Pseudomonadota bacterium]